MILSSLNCVDAVVSSSDVDPIFDFRKHIADIHPDILAVTEDDNNIEQKRLFCDQNSLELVMLKKTSSLPPVSTTSIITSLQ